MSDAVKDFLRGTLAALAVPGLPILLGLGLIMLGDAIQ